MWWRAEKKLACTKQTNGSGSERRNKSSAIIFYHSLDKINFAVFINFTKIINTKIVFAPIGGYILNCLLVSALWFRHSDPARDNLLLLSWKPQNSKMIITKLPLFLPSERKLFTLNNAPKQKIILKNFYFANFKIIMIIIILMLLLLGLTITIQLNIEQLIAYLWV